MKRHKPLLVVFISLVFIFSFHVVLAQEPSDFRPNLQISIGGFGGENDFNDGRPGTWIAQYISVIYQYGIGLAAILAVIMIMVGGLIWLTSAGRSGQIDTGKDFIKSALLGLLLAMFSFILLYSINPSLTKFKPLDIASPNLTSPASVDRQPPRDDGNPESSRGCCYRTSGPQNRIDSSSCIDIYYSDQDNLVAQCNDIYGTGAVSQVRGSCECGNDSGAF